MSMPLPPFSPDFGPVPNITPFTYRDGRTYLDKLTGLVYWANNSLVPQMNEAVEIVINDGIQLQDPVMAGIVENDTSATVGQLNAKYEQILTSAITYTVGENGDFDTINQALTHLSRFKPIFNNMRVELNLLSGFVMTEQVKIVSRDFGWIRITSEDPEVVISRVALSVRDGRWFSAWQLQNSVGPIIECLFRMDTSGNATDRVGFYLRGSKIVFGDSSGMLNSGERNIDCAGCSSLVFEGSEETPPNFSGALQIGVRVSNASQAHLDGVIIANCGVVNLSVADACLVNAADATLTGAGLYGVDIGGPSWVSLNGADMSNAGRYGVRAFDGHTTMAQGKAENCTEAGVYAKNGAIVHAGTDSDLEVPVTVSGSAKGFVAQLGAVINAQRGVADNCGTGVEASQGGIVAFALGKARNCTGTGIAASNAGTIDALNAVATGCGFGITAFGGSTVNATAANISGAISVGADAADGSTITALNANTRKGVADSTLDMRVRRGGIIAASGATGGVSTTVNTLTAAGIIYR